MSKHSADMGLPCPYSSVLLSVPGSFPSSFGCHESLTLLQKGKDKSLCPWKM